MEIMESGRMRASMRTGIVALVFALVSALLAVPMGSGEGVGGGLGATSAEATHAPNQYPFEEYRLYTRDGCGSSRSLRFKWYARARVSVSSTRVGYEFNSSRTYDGHWYSRDIYQGSEGYVGISFNLIDTKRTYFYCSA